MGIIKEAKSRSGEMSGGQSGKRETENWILEFYNNLVGLKAQREGLKRGDGSSLK